jgi:EAL and modified HD-GYP domain-containing signal transduction protein
MAMLRLTQKLQDPDITVKQVEALVMQDPALTYKLLRIINSAAYALANRVKSLDQAIVMLGIEQIKKWVMLIALGSNGNKPEEMTRMLLVRGRMCELLAQAMQRENTNGYFMAGMLSEINALLDIDMDVMLEQISLHNDIKLAISSYRGHMGEVLQATMAYERAEWERLSEYDIEDALYEAAYVESIRWAEQAMSALHA